MSTSPRIGFIGLGNMGTPIAKNLLRAGFDLMVYNRTRSKTMPFEKDGAKIAASFDDLAKHADVLMTMLSDDAAVRDICNDVVPKLASGTIHIAMSTVSQSTTDDLNQLHHTHGVQCVTAPVMGRPPAAEARTLNILLSGEESAKQKVKPILDVVGQRIFDFGTIAGTSNTVKLMLNFMIFTNVELLSEVMLFAEKMNVDKKQLMETINNTQLASPALKIYGELLTSEREVLNGFATDLANKDLRLAQETAAKQKLTLPLAELIRAHFEEAIAAGDGSKDVTVVMQHLRKKLT